MERRDLFRRAVASRRLIPNWLVALVFGRTCREVTYNSPETDDRAKRIGAACPNCVCECVSVGRHGSPGNVGPEEKLHSIVVRPIDIDDKDALIITMITHAQKKGMSVLRERASNDEFHKIITARIPDPNKRSLFGIATVSCCAVRGIVAKESNEQRLRDDRLFSVLDSDMEGLPNHADIFATLPRPHEVRTPKAAWQQEREKLLNLLSEGLETADVFRNGSLK